MNDMTFAMPVQPSHALERTRNPVVVIIDDDGELFEAFNEVCECLEVEVERIASSSDLNRVLQRHNPMAVVAELDADGQDGCHVLMTVASHDKDLPVLIRTGEDPALLGAVDAVESMWRLSAVTRWPTVLNMAATVDFLFQAGRKAGCIRLLPG